MSVIDESQDVRFLDVNAAWCQEMLRARDDVVGRSFADLGLLSLEKRDYREIVPMDAENMEREVWLPRGDGEPVQLQAYGRRIRAKNLAVWAWVDIGPLRSVERALRVLNSDLEERVAERSDSLAASNAELSATAERLRLAQAELVRSEKMAALGGLVAGVAHELNTPIGNGVMAVSTLTSVVQRFRQSMDAGVRRADLTQLIEAVEQGCNIAGRNLRRAADLVHSFKQVAVDQTSAQRRSFELSEVVHEMVASLKPSFARQPWRIDVEMPASGLRLDSYPGALGQVLGNLIQNAVLHGFEGREHGTVCITAGRQAGRDGDDGLWLRVADNGRGIAAEHIDRIFDPFMTTRMGRGGTGLGLHISYNAVVNLLGGTLVVQSAQGEGACFELCLPLQAPRAPSPCDDTARAASAAHG